MRETVRDHMSDEAKLKPCADVLEDIYHLLPGWREAVAELEDFCSEPVRLKNMLAALNQMDDCKAAAKKALEAAWNTRVKP